MKTTRAWLSVSAAALAAIVATSRVARTQSRTDSGVLSPVAGSVLVDFNAQTVGGPSTDFEAVVGDWYVAQAAGARALRVDGSRWRQGTPSASLADQARRLYGDRYAEFLDGVRSFAFFPLAVYRGTALAANFRASVRFYPQDGRIDQAAGIAFDIQPNGNYLTVRANALEDNILFCRVLRGRRSIVETIRNTPTSTRSWHTLVVSVRGRRLTADLDGVPRMARDLESVPTGRLGLWSKADSQVLFDDFRIDRLE